MLRDGPEAQTLEQTFPTVAEYDQIGLILIFCMADDLLGGMTHSNFKMLPYAVRRCLRLERRQDFLVVFT